MCDACKEKNAGIARQARSPETWWAPLAGAMSIVQPKAFKVSDDKRFKLPGCKLSGGCPNCGEAFKVDFGQHYLGRPKANEPFDLALYCHDCGHEWSVRAQLNISLSLLGENT